MPNFAISGRTGRSDWRLFNYHQSSDALAGERRRRARSSTRFSDAASMPDPPPTPMSLVLPPAPAAATPPPLLHKRRMALVCIATPAKYHRSSCGGRSGRRWRFRRAHGEPAACAQRQQPWGATCSDAPPSLDNIPGQHAVTSAAKTGRALCASCVTIFAAARQPRACRLGSLRPQRLSRVWVTLQLLAGVSAPGRVPGRRRAGRPAPSDGVVVGWLQRLGIQHGGHRRRHPAHPLRSQHDRVEVHGWAVTARGGQLGPGGRGRVTRRAPAAAPGGAAQPTRLMDARAGCRI